VISFRYHLVSIVAVFFALAIGILVGTTVLPQVTIRQLREQTDSARLRADNLRAELDRVEGELGTSRQLAESLEPIIIRDQLLGRASVIVTAQGVDAAEIGGVRDALEQAGSVVKGILVFSNRMALDGPTDAQDLAAVLGTTDLDPASLAETTGTEVGARLAEGAAPFQTDLLQDLVTGGFLAVQAQPDLTQIGGPDQTVVQLTGSADAPVFDPGPVFLPMLSTLVSGGMTSAAAETTDTSYPYVEAVRDDGGLDGKLVTVDNGNTSAGRVSLVIALKDLIQTGRGGDYGTKPGSTGLLPPA
jgi:hypothetical protein